MAPARKVEYLTWLYVECLLPFAVVLMILPVILLTPMDGHKFMHKLLEVFTEGEIPAVAFCMLVPTFILALQESESQLVLGLLLAGGLFAIMCYTVCKIAPIDLQSESNSQAAVCRAVLTAVLMAGTVWLAIRVRSAILADALKKGD